MGQTENKRAKQHLKRVEELESMGISGYDTCLKQLATFIAFHKRKNIHLSEIKLDHTDHQRIFKELGSFYFQTAKKLPSGRFSTINVDGVWITEKPKLGA